MDLSGSERRRFLYGPVLFIRTDEKVAGSCMLLFILTNKYRIVILT